MPVAFGRRVLLPALVEITRPHPNLTFTLTLSDATSDLLRDDVDIAIRFGALKDSLHLVARRLATQKRVICAAPEYLDAMDEPLTLEDIGQHRCIVGTPKGPPLVWMVEENDVQTRFTPPPTHQMTDGEAMVDAAVCGLGIGQFALFQVRDHLNAGRLKAILENYSCPGVDIHAVWPKRAQLSPRVRYVVDELGKQAQLGRFN